MTRRRLGTLANTVDRALNVGRLIGPQSSVDGAGRPFSQDIGRIFFVDPSSGNDSADGQDPERPLLTLNAAIALCTADQGDFIIVFPGSHAVSAQVVFNVRGITVSAVEFGSPDEEAAESFTVNAGSSLTSGSPAKILDPCTIIGLGFQGRDLTAEDLLIDCEEAGGFNGGFNQLINCRFGVWYGAVDYGIRMVGGAINKVIECSFDGLFGGFDIGAIGMENDTGGITPAYTEILGCRFQGVGPSKHAIVHDASSTPVGVLYAHNYLLPGFIAAAANVGAFLDNNNVASTGMVADNWTGLADKATAFENLTNSSLVFADNHYDE